MLNNTPVFLHRNQSSVSLRRKEDANSNNFNTSEKQDIRMVSSGMFGRVVLVRTDVSEELSASYIMVTRIGVLGTTLALTSS
jgi:hypothetical protein